MSHREEALATYEAESGGIGVGLMSAGGDHTVGADAMRGAFLHGYDAGLKVLADKLGSALYDISELATDALATLEEETPDAP